MNWYLKKNDGNVYGPVDLDAFRQWAADGRIEPEDSVSDDENHWQPATSLSPLAMDWIVELADGSKYGPLHLLALKELFRSGTLSPDARIVHKTTQESRQLGSALLVALMEQNQSLQELVDETAARIRELEGQKAQSASAAELQATAHELQAELSDALQRRDHIEKEAERSKKLYEEERDRAARREADLGEELQKIRQGEASALSRLEVAEQENALRRPSPEAMAKESNLSDDTAELVSSYNDLSRSYDRLLTQLTDVSAELGTVLETRDKTQQEASERIRNLEEATRRSEETGRQLRQRLTDMEVAHVDVIRSYRELNDRYIRLRQQQGPAAPPRAASPPVEKKPPEGEPRKSRPN